MIEIIKTKQTDMANQYNVIGETKPHRWGTVKRFAFIYLAIGFSLSLIVNVLGLLGVRHVFDFGDVPFYSAFIWEGSLQDFASRLFWLFIIPALFWPLIIALVFYLYFFRGWSVFYW